MVGLAYRTDKTGNKGDAPGKILPVSLLTRLVDGRKLPHLVAGGPRSLPDVVVFDIEHRVIVLGRS